MNPKKGRTLIATYHCVATGGYREAKYLLHGKLSAHHEPRDWVCWSSVPLANSFKRNYTAEIWRMNEKKSLS